MVTKNLFPKLLLITFAISACANVSNASLNQISTPTESNSFAIAEISKPTYTPSPTATFLPTQTPTITPEPIAQAEIVEDAPNLEYAASLAQIYEAEAPQVYTGG
ncbi:MAG: hypothetical protein HC797_08115, partial [Anaerolineales bacterium]|nr:hypothetical protein [Anaerolineales bacterium]